MWTPHRERCEALNREEVRDQLFASFKPWQRLSSGHAQGRQPAEGIEVEAVGGLVELNDAPCLAFRVGEPGVDALPPRLLDTQVYADEHDRTAQPKPVGDVVGLARELEFGGSLASKSDFCALDLGQDGDPCDFPVGVHEFDLTVDGEVTLGVVPHVAGVGYGLVDECLAPEPSPLLDAALRHPISAPRRTPECPP